MRILGIGSPSVKSIFGVRCAFARTTQCCGRRWNLGYATRGLRFIAAVVCLAATLSLAQSTNSSVTGRIVDPENAVVVGAEVTIINPQTKIHYNGWTNEDGIYLISDIQPGTYFVQVAKP